jgi:hypothetical protein
MNRRIVGRDAAGPQPQEAIQAEARATSLGDTKPDTRLSSARPITTDTSHLEPPR